MTTGSDVYLDGFRVPRDKASVSVFDRGFLFGDGVYEVIPVYNRRPFLAAQHVRRLTECLAQIGISDPHGKQGWIDLIDQLASRQQFADQKIYIQVTRGTAPRRLCFPAHGRPTVLMFADPMNLPEHGKLQRGCAAVTHEDYRWRRGDIKSISLLAAVLLSEHAAAHGADETILIRDGKVTEGASSNVLVCTAGKLAAPASDRLVLRGVTLEHIEKIAAQHGRPVARRDIGEDELRTADEVIICSSTREVSPVTVLDGRQVGDGRAGRQALHLADLYRASTCRPPD